MDYVYGEFSATDIMEYNHFSSERHRVTAVDRKDLEFALKDLMDQINFGTMPFLDSDLTDGIITLIVQNCHKICRQEDLQILVPGLTRSTQLDIMDIFENIFGLKSL